MRHASVLCAALAAGAWIGGCANQPLPPAAAVQATGDAEFNAVWSSAERVLRQWRFVIDRADRRAGVITTFPMVAQYWSEFWRRDGVAARDRAEGSLHALSRQATVTVRRAGQAEGPPAKWAAVVEVRTRRSNRPTPQVTSVADAYEMFQAAEAEPPRRAEGFAAPAADVWSDLGRDKRLEQILQQRIAALARQTPQAPAKPR